jgi:hypothetical protein
MSVDRSTAKSWHQAADAAIATTLEIDDLPDHGLLAPRDLGLARGLSAEQYFARISRLPATRPDGNPAYENALDLVDGCGSGADGIARAHELGADADLGAVGTLDAVEIRRQVAIQYQAHATGRGTEPGDALRWVRRILEPRVPWEQLLTAAVRNATGWAAGRGAFTYSRPSRRASTNPRVVLPGQRRPVPRLAIVVDTSASVDDALLAQALGEVDGAIASLGVPGSHVTIYSVDAAVHTVSRVRHSRDAKLVGAGGTDLRLGLDAAGSERPRPDVIIVFTDGDTPWPATPPTGSAVIVGLLGRDRMQLPPTPKWATRVECVID